MKQSTIIVLVVVLVLAGLFTLNGTRHGMYGFWGGERGFGHMWNDEDEMRGSRYKYEKYAEYGTEDFKFKIEEAVRVEIGQPIEGYEPMMFLQVFPGLHESDFDDVEALIGRYVYVNGELQHDLEGAELVHSAAGTLSEKGITTLLQNVAARLEIQMDADIDEVIQLLTEDNTDDDKIPPKPTPPVEEPVACTMDAMQCPDGSYVGRTGPNCEFVCPAPSTDSNVTYCEDVRKDGNKVVCQLEFAEVCAMVEVQCVTTPCNPVPETIMNGCIACHERDNVISYTQGACAI